MQLRGINFRPVANAAGTQGFFGEGYWYHRYAKRIGLTFQGCCFIAKTTTLRIRTGNMLLSDKDGITPVERMPKCIVVKPWKGIVLNAVGLSGPGAEHLLTTGYWQQRTEPFFLSFMSVEGTPSKRLTELKRFIYLFKQYLGNFKVPVGLEINLSCPNAGLDPDLLVYEGEEALEEAARLNTPLQLKFNALVPAEAVCKIAQHEACDAITMSNTIPWGKLPERINWKRLFGSEKSPLDHLGGGGLSGWPLRDIVREKIRQIRDCGLRKPIWACGGIDSVNAVTQACEAGASGIQFGTVAIVRPWRTKSIIQQANHLFQQADHLFS
jgi:dihydroorotate dehydrogenase